MNLPRLPIDDVLPAILDGLRDNAALVLRAETAAGKTTRVPPAILDAGLAGRGQIVVVQPRRLAARAAAGRMADERSGRVGDEVGYQVRFERKTGPNTRINVVTEGILIRMLRDDPFLERVSVVLFDEFHERNLDSDVALAMARRVQQTVRPELKIVVMSATLDPAPIAAYFGGCPTVQSQGRLHAVDIRYIDRADGRPATELAVEGVQRALDASDGDILVFLPGVGEIHQTARLLESLADERDLVVMKLHGALPSDRQDAALRKADRRKVVLATNVAETSVTVEGVTAVVDSGLARSMEFDADVGLDRLRLGPISQASAEQRAGRAGRTSAGVCFRLWTRPAHRVRPQRQEPEIRRVDLCGAVLQLQCWGESDVAAFPWFEPPSAESLRAAQSLLERLGARDSKGPTPLGHAMARLPVHPRLARLLLEARRLGEGRRAALVAAMLSEREAFLRSDRRGSGRSSATRHSNSDVLDRLVALEDYERRGRLETPFGSINRGAADFLFRVRDQLVRQIASSCTRQSAESPAFWRTQLQRVSSDEALLRSLLVAFPDRLARRTAPGSRHGVLVGGRGVRLMPTSAVDEAELFVCVDVDRGRGEAIVRQASEARREWLDADRVETRTEVSFDPSAGRVVARRRTFWEDLLLDETPAALPSGQQTTAILAQAAAERFDRVFPWDDPAVKGFVTRVRCLREWMPELEMPSWDDQALQAMLSTACAGRRSLAEVRKAPWLGLLKGSLPPMQLRAVEREAPERIEVPSGSRIVLRYEEGRPPVLAARIQEVFGLRETPRVAGGRVKVLIHLLAPNMRPQQVTDDLASFWANTYSQVRKDLRRRYPKHAWPEDPSQGVAERRPKRRRPD